MKKILVILGVLVLMLISVAPTYARGWRMPWYFRHYSKPTATPTVTPIPTPTATPKADTSSNTLNLYVTFYGWPDNTPAGTEIAYPVIHSGAGGTGTYADPITFAAHDTQRFPKGTIVYLPVFKKYFIMEDYNVNSTPNHIDLWMNSDGRYNDAVLSCENYWTQDNTEVVVNPASNLEVNSTPLFNTNTGECLH